MANDRKKDAGGSDPDELVTDRFALAVKHAQGAMPDEAWWRLEPRERSQAIYAALRVLDAAAAEAWHEKWVPVKCGNKTAG